MVACLLAVTTSVTAGERCQPYVQHEAGRRTAHLRAHTDAMRECTLDEAGYRRLVARWAGGTEPASTLFLGRAIHYPWLSRLIARAALADPGWDEAIGRPLAGGINAYVTALLARADIAARLAEPLTGSGLSMTGVSVEKVLVDRAGERVPGAPDRDARVPFDALVWLTLESRAPSAD